jgi:Na+/H+ antiporter NhaD/arsenite permease-like protein
VYYAIVATFIIGYLGIALEHKIKIDKASIALLTGGICWTLLVFSQNILPADIPLLDRPEWINDELAKSLAEISSIVFFLLGAMTIVEVIDAHEGFQLVTEVITTKSKVKLLWFVSLITFFLSAVLDNLTTTIIIATVLRKLISDREELLEFGGMVVLAANAGGAWSPIGDITTIMLWAGGQVSAMNIIAKLLLPSIVCLIVPLIFLSFKLKGVIEAPEMEKNGNSEIKSFRERLFFLVAGISSLLFVLFFKIVTHLPPYLGMLISLGVMWIISEVLKSNRQRKERDVVTMVGVLKKLDLPTLFFFLGILLAVGALETSGHLHHMAQFLDSKFSSIISINFIIGILSSIVDNVPLVAGAIGMYPFDIYPPDHAFWELLAFCAGTGGSILVIGSAAGVAIMGILKMDFIWYLKKMTALAFMGYVAGIVTFYLLNM